ncbi:MAG: prephenate dehydratase domain-containing protein [Candidatus Gracilibacteria bacterium]
MKISKKKLYIAVAGDRGSFSELACKKYAKENSLKDYEIIYAIDSKGVEKQLLNGIAKIGILPLRNIICGHVAMTQKILEKENCQIVDSTDLEIEQCLFGIKRIKLNQIKEVVSHEQAIKQCEKNLKRLLPKAKITKYIDTAKAAHDLSAGLLSKETAVIGPKNLGKMYGLNLLKEKIEDAKNNRTIFLVVTVKGVGSYRKNIDDIDKKIIRLLGQRLACSKQIGEIKRKTKKPIFDEKRELKLMNMRKKEAKKMPIDTDFIEKIFDTILQESKNIQK